MKGRQIILIGTTLLLVAILFYLGYKSPVGKTPDVALAAASEFNFSSYLEQSKSKTPEALKEKIRSLEESKTDQTSLLTLARIWDSLQNPYISAHYAFELAEREPNEQNWQVAGSKFYNVAGLTTDSAMQADAAVNARKAFEKVLTFNPQNFDAKNALGILYIQIDKDIMKGVRVLKEVLATDSNNIQAIFTLGMLSVQSGQLDKAAARFRKLISLQPFNPDYYYYLAEVYAKMGQKEEAIKTYETCKSLLKDTKQKKEIESLINHLKNT